jgi:hypothetical protein
VIRNCSSVFNNIIRFSAFIKKAFCKYKRFHKKVKSRFKSGWHNHSVQRANDFISIMNGKKTDVYQMVNHGLTNG